MDVSTPPSLDLACPQAKAKIDRGVDKIKYGHEGIMIIFKTTTYCQITSYAKVIIHSQGKV